MGGEGTMSRVSGRVNVGEAGEVAGQRLCGED